MGKIREPGINLETRWTKENCSIASKPSWVSWKYRWRTQGILCCSGFPRRFVPGDCAGGERETEPKQTGEGIPNSTESQDAPAAQQCSQITTLGYRLLDDCKREAYKVLNDLARVRARSLWAGPWMRSGGQRCPGQQRAPPRKRAQSSRRNPRRRQRRSGRTGSSGWRR